MYASNKAAEVKYADRAIVYGSLAYDFEYLSRNVFKDADTAGEEFEAEYELPAKTGTAARARSAVKAGSDALAIPIGEIALTAVIGYLIAGLLLVMVLMSYIQFTIISDQSVSIAAQITQLKEEHARLIVDFERAVNLNEVERYAIQELGMIAPTSDQFNYFDLSGTDTAIILKDGKGSDSAADGFFKGIVNGLAEYFE